jgi:hypothetical protein
MKNIFLLPTDKPSRLCIDNSCNELNYSEIEGLNTKHITNQHIYITSDEEIKEGDWMIRGNEQPTLVTPNFFWDFGVRYYKIILTTDQDLIKDGVQAIDDEFLEWFVENPSCEEVKIELHIGSLRWEHSKNTYKIIIPQEEPKQERERGITITHVGKPKQETLEEASWKHNPLKKLDGEFLRHAFKEGAKWQQEQDKKMYSEEDMKQFAWECVANFLSNNDNKVEMSLVEVIMDRNDKKFEQFKKK